MPKPPKPVLASVPTRAPRPIVKNVPEKRRFTFSFRFWCQRDLFGVGDKDGGWCAAIFERLNALSNEYIDEFERDTVKQETYRFHPVDWNGRNVPLARSDFDWVPRVYLDDPDQYPFFVFHVSKALGRIVGFWGEDRHVFNILLLDPMHNIQPSQYNSYQIRPTNLGICDYTKLVQRAEKYISQCQCANKSELQENFYSAVDDQSGAAAVFRMSEQTVCGIRRLIASGVITDTGEAIEGAVSALLQDLKQTETNAC